MAFLLHIGYIGLKYPLLTQEVLIGLKKGQLTPKPAFLDIFLFHYKTYFAIKIFFCKAKSLLVARRLLTPKKVVFEPKNQNFDQNSHFFAPKQP
jgi:hypothetical protein